MRICRGATIVVLVCVVACKDDREAAKTSPPVAQGSGVAVSPHRNASLIAVPAGLLPADQVAAEQARDALLAACAATPLDANDFKEVTLSVNTALGYLKDKFDWERMVSVAFVYKEGIDRGRGGHRVTFNLGAGNRPGIVTSKSQGIQLCGFTGRARGVVSGKPCDPDAGEDCILDVPGLKVLDSARPPAVVESQRAAPSAWCFGHGFDPPQFWTCASNETNCKRARALEKREENDDYKVRTTCTKTDSLHCFVGESGKTVCAPDAAACATSRKEWTNLQTASPCEVATSASLEASTKATD